MRLGIVVIPHAAPPGATVVERLVDFARRAEALSFDTFWLTDAFGRGGTTLDPYGALGAVCAVTTKIELGTCIVQVPVRNAMEHAHRVQTIHLLSNGRFRFGVGTGSNEADFDLVGADFAARFKALPRMLDDMKRVYDGKTSLGIWPGTEGGPPVLLGALRNPRSIAQAAKLDGWISSGIRSTWDDVEIGTKMYRDAGGTRAVVANVFADFRDGAATGRNLTISMVGATRAAARDTLRRLADLGVDDAAIVCPFDDPSQMETIRGLV